MTNWRKTRVGKLFVKGLNSEKNAKMNTEKVSPIDNDSSSHNASQTGKTGNDDLNTIEGQEVHSATETGPEAVSNDQPSDNDEVETLMLKLNDLNDKYLRLFSEFDNYRKRTAKEKSDLIKTAGEDIFKMLLPVLDDFERGLKMMETSSDVAALKQGVDLVYSKLNSGLTQKGLEPMTSIGLEFNADIHEAITNFPVDDPEKKGKVIE